MTAPPATTALAALRRADRGWCKETADEPLDETRLDHLAAAVQDRLDSWAAPADEVTELRAEVEQLREQLVAEHRDTLRAIGMLEAARRERDEALAEVARLENHASEINGQWEQHHQNDVLPYTSRLEDERDQAVSELDRWALALVDANQQLAAARRDAGTWEGEFDRVVDDKLVELTEALEERDRARAERDQALAELARVHQHAWDVQPGLKAMGLPCACGRPWPSTARAQQAEAGAG